MKGDAGVEEDDIIYRESQGFFSSWWFCLLMVAFIIVLIWFAVVSVRDGPAWGAVFFGALAIFLIFALISFWRLEFVISEEHVTFGFGVLKKTLSRSRIVSCEPYLLRLRNYLGYGIRFGILDGTIAFNTRNGKGIKMEIEGVKRSYVVSVDNPERVIELLNPNERP